MIRYKERGHKGKSKKQQVAGAVVDAVCKTLARPTIWAQQEELYCETRGQAFTGTAVPFNVCRNVYEAIGNRLQTSSLTDYELDFGVQTEDIYEDEVLEFIDEVYFHALASDAWNGVRCIHMQFNIWLNQERFDVCDAALANVNLDYLGVDLILSFLTITRAARDKLSKRSSFYSSAWKVIENLRGPVTTNKLLAHLT